MTDPQHAATRPPRSDRKRGLLTVLIAAACSVCLLPAVAGGAVLASVGGWLTGATGLAAAAIVVATTAAALMWKRRSRRSTEVGGCDKDCT